MKSRGPSPKQVELIPRSRDFRKLSLRFAVFTAPSFFKEVEKERKEKKRKKTFEGLHSVCNELSFEALHVD